MLRETTQTAEFGTYPRYSSVKSGMGALETAAFRNTNFSVSFSSECGLKKCRARERKDSPEGGDVRRELGLTLFRKPLQRERAQKRRRTPSGFVKTVQNRSTSNQFILRSNCTKCFPSPDLIEIGYRVFNRLSISGRQNTM